MSTHASYRHAQLFKSMWLTMPLPALIVSVAALRGPDVHLTQAVLIAWAVCVVGLASLGRLEIELRGDELHWTFGFLGWPHWSVPLRDIVKMESVRASAWRGAGIKGLGKDKLFSVSIGGPALRLNLTGGRMITLGTPEPDRLKDFIEARRPQPR
jgi:hypothetical protein